MIRLAHAPIRRILEQHWARSEPDLVVSLVPNFNRVLCESVAAALPGVPYVTVLTDFADHPPHFWIEPGQDQWLVCGTPRALAQARAAGYADERIALTSGMLLRPSFYAPPPVERREVRRRALGLDSAPPTGVVMFGGQGSRQMLAIAKALPDTQLVLLCGHNAALAQALRRLQRPAPQAVFGFSDEVPNLMRLGDFFIGKPGPGCLSEAVHLGLPVITFRNAWTMPQERYNAQWVREQGVGLVLPSLRGLPAAVAQLQRELPAYRAATARLHNRAVFELPEILAERLFAAQAVAA
jgi:UDP-N-acetylglucosamine:LPS N-acetylglucosamine transferase